MLTAQEARAIVANIQYLDWQIHIEGEQSPEWLQVRFMAPCTKTGRIGEQRCRKWKLSAHMVPTEIVRTAWKAVAIAVEHEAAEQFLYKGVPIFNPHMNVERLVEACKARDAEDVRPENVILSA